MSHLVASPGLEPLSDAQIEALPVYEWDVARVGDEAPRFTYEVTAESIADYCAAVRNANPLYLDAGVAHDGPFRGIIAPPTFAFKCAPLRRNEVMHARGYASPEEKGARATPYAKAELFLSRPLRPGDEITSIVRLEDKYERRNSQFITWRTTAVDARGMQVLEYTYTIIWSQGPREPGMPTVSSIAPTATAPTATAPTATAPTAALHGEPLPALTKLESQEAIDRYAELTRVRPRHGHSLHSDESFAKRTIFGGTVNMGVATLAYCSEVLEAAFGPAPLLHPGARLEFKGIRPIRAGDEITLRASVTERTAAQATCQLTVHNQDNTLVGIGDATLVLEP